MKVANWTDGTQTIRKTNTRDYKFAYRFQWEENGKWEVGFSTTLKSLNSAAASATKRTVSKPRGGDYRTKKWYNDYINSEYYKRDLEIEMFARKSIQIVEVA